MTATAVTPEHGRPDGAEPTECAVHLLPPLERELSTPAEVADYLEDLGGWLHALSDAASLRVVSPDMLPLDLQNVLGGVARFLRTGAPLRTVDGESDAERAEALWRFLRELLAGDATNGHDGRPIGQVCPEVLRRIAIGAADAAERARDEA